MYLLLLLVTRSVVDIFGDDVAAPAAFGPEEAELPLPELEPAPLPFPEWFAEDASLPDGDDDILTVQDLKMRRRRRTCSAF